MEEETLHQRWLVVVAIILGALIIVYNVFYVPDVSLSGISVVTDGAPHASGSAAVSSTASSSVFSSQEEYTPRQPSLAASNSSKSSMQGKVNINTATAQQISEGLDGIGDVMAKRIVEYREQHGVFRSVSDLKNVSGIGDKTYAKIQNSVTVG